MLGTQYLYYEVVHILRKYCSKLKCFWINIRLFSDLSC